MCLVPEGSSKGAFIKGGLKVVAYGGKVKFGSTGGGNRGKVRGGGGGKITSMTWLSEVAEDGERF